MSKPSSNRSSDPLRPDDHVDAPRQQQPLNQPKLGFVGWLRYLWRQLTSMRTAIVLLLMLAVAAIPGSLVPQRSSDPNGVIEVRNNNPDLVWLYDAFELHNVYGSVWFSAIYVLLFVSLVGCVVPRLVHHWRAMMARPPRTPKRLNRLVGYTVVDGGEADLDKAASTLRRLGYRIERYDNSVSAERGYLRETGNLLFHVSMLVVLLSVALGSGFGHVGQRLVLEGDRYANTLTSYDTFNGGRWFDDSQLQPYAIGLDKLDVVYETENMDAFGQPIDFTAHVQVTEGGETRQEQVKVNEPLNIAGDDVFLLSNGYAPEITVTAPDGTVVFHEAVPFLAQDNQMTSLGVIKLSDGLAEQVGLRGFFYPTAVQLETGAFASSYPDVVNPLMTFQVFTGDLGLNSGAPQNVYVLNTDDLTQVAGGDSGTDALTLAPGQTVELPGGLGTISFDNVVRYAVFDVRYDATKWWVAVSTAVLIFALLLSLLVPRRRIWVKTTDEGLEVAGLARGEDPTLARAVADVAKRIAASGSGPAHTDEPR